MKLRRAIFVLALLGLTGTVVAQTPTAPQTWLPNGRQLLANGTHVTFKFGQLNDWDMRSGVVRLSGGVTVDIQGTKITADEATLDTRAGEFRLHGDVRLR